MSRWAHWGWTITLDTRVRVGSTITLDPVGPMDPICLPIGPVVPVARLGTSLAVEITITWPQWLGPMGPLQWAQWRPIRQFGPTIVDPDQMGPTKKSLDPVVDPMGTTKNHWHSGPIVPHLFAPYNYIITYLVWGPHNLTCASDYCYMGRVL